MRVLTAVSAVFSVLIVASPAWATTVESEAGEVFIDRGQGFAPVSGSTPAQAGDMVMAMAGGRGVIIYDDGCREVVEVGDVEMVDEVSPCAAGLSEAAVDNVYLYTGLAVVGIAGIIIALSDDDDNGDKPITKNKK